MSCSYEDDSFVFELNDIKCIISTKDEDGNSLRPNGNLSEFYKYLKRQSQCEMEFDNKHSSLIISANGCDYFRHYRDVCNCEMNVQFKTHNTTVTLKHELCFEAIQQFLQQFTFKI